MVRLGDYRRSDSNSGDLDMELIIRAWDKKKKVMSPDMPFFMAVGWFAAHYNSGKDLTDFILMPYTGLEDKNGKRIFEGDVLQQLITTPTGYRLARGKMQFYTNKAQFGIFMDVSDGDPLANGHMEVRESVDGRPEIVGDIYRNPELVQKEK